MGRIWEFIGFLVVEGGLLLYLGLKGQFVITALAVTAFAFAIWQSLRQKPPDD